MFPSLMFATGKEEVTEDLWTVTHAWTYNYQNDRYSNASYMRCSWYNTSQWGWWEWGRAMCKFNLTWLPPVATQVILDLDNATMYYSPAEIKAASCHSANWTNSTRSSRRSWSYYRTWIAWPRWTSFDITDIYNMWMASTLTNNWIQIEPVNPNTVKTNDSWFNGWWTWAAMPKLTITY